MAFGTSIQLARAASLPKDPTRKKGTSRRSLPLRLQQFRENAPPKISRLRTTRISPPTVASVLGPQRGLTIAGRRREQTPAQAAISEHQAGEDASRQAASGRLAQALSLLSGQGRVEQARIARRSHLARGRAEQRLVSRGLGGTTVVSPILRAIDESASLQSADVTERVSRAQAGVIERVSDIPPSRGPVLSALRDVGAEGAQRPVAARALTPATQETEAQVAATQARPALAPRPLLPGGAPTRHLAPTRTPSLPGGFGQRQPVPGFPEDSQAPFTYEEFIKLMDMSDRPPFEQFMEYQGYREVWDIEHPLVTFS